MSKTKIDYGLNISVPAQNTEEVHSIDALARKIVGSNKYDAGFGMGYRDLDFFFSTLEEAIKVGSRVRTAFTKAGYVRRKRPIIFVHMLDIDL